MRYLRAITGLLMTLLSGQTLALAEAKPNLDDVAQLETFVDGFISGHTSPGDNNAVTLAIVKDGKILFSKGYGLANIDEDITVSPDTSLFRIGSTSKTFTYTAIMQLYEQGKLDLDADVNTYLKDFKIPDAFEEAVTIKHILTHSAGFEDSMLGHLFVASEEEIIPFRQAVEKFRPERINPVGKYSSYSNFAISLLGVVVEDVSGQSFEEYIKNNIYAPLGMTNSTFRQPLPEPLNEQITNSYYKDGGKWVARDFTLITNDTPAGGMSSTAVDMSKFMLMHLGDGIYNGNRILKPETAQLMRSWLFGPDTKYPGMAYGFYQQDINGFRLYGHGGATLYYLTDMMMDPANDLGIFISSTGSNYGEISMGFVETLYDYYFPVTERSAEPVAPADFADRVENYTGQYLNLRANFSKIEKLFQIMGGSVVSATDSNTLLIDGNQYVEVGEHLFQNINAGDLLLFKAGEDGQIVSLHEVNNATGTMIKAPFYNFGSFNFLFFGASVFLFITVLVGFLYRRKDYNTYPGDERKALHASLVVSGVNILFFVLAGVTVASKGMMIILGIPDFFYVVMLLPIVASLMAFVQARLAINVWQKWSWGISKKIHYSLVTAAGLFMAWFYYFWNVLGFQYY